MRVRRRRRGGRLRRPGTLRRVHRRRGVRAAVAHLAAGAAHLCVSRRRVGGCGPPGARCCWSSQPAGARHADAHDRGRGAGADSRRRDAAAAPCLGRRRLRPRFTPHRSRPASRSMVSSPPANGRDRSGRHLRGWRPLHGRRRPPGRRPARWATCAGRGRRCAARARRFRRWPVVSARRCAQSVRRGLVPRQARRRRSAGRGDLRGVPRRGGPAVRCAPATAAHDAPRWVRDRGVRFSVAVAR